MVLPRKRIHSGKVVNSLVRLHLVKAVDGDSVISPKNVPLVFFVVAVFVALAVRGKSHIEQIFCNVSYNMVLGL